MDADTPDSEGTVQARLDHQGDWQKLVIEAKDPATTTAPAATTPAPATTAAPMPTTPEPATTVAPCVEKQSLGQCQQCLKTEQCADGKYCCPYMKKCVGSSSDSCFYPIAGCRPMCYDSKDNSQCTCQNPDFPDKWQLPTCERASDATTSVSATTQPPSATTQPPAATTQSAPIATTPPPGAEEQEVSSLEWEHFELLNQLRAQGFTCPQGAAFEPNLVPLKFDCRLWKASQLHSEDMAAQGYFSHSSQDGRSPWQRAEEQGTSANGENIAAGSGTAAGVLEQWKRSDGHCRNMMKKDSKVAGVGYGAGGPYRHYWTQMFSDSDTSDLDTTCYPSSVAPVQSGMEADAEDTHEKILVEPWSRTLA
jgi:uncharacterized protein YkwD